LLAEQEDRTMTDDLRSLRLLLAQAEGQRDEALAEQLKLDAAWRAAAAQAEQLVLYRREYEQRWRAEFCREGKIELVRCYQGFIERLTQAVEQQERVATQTAEQAERAAAIMRGHDVRAAALKKLIERRIKEGDRVAAGREQRQHDEHASRAAWVRFAETNVRGPI
jgi:flagellar FliJ protein